MTTATSTTSNQKDLFENEGYVIVRELFSIDEIAALSEASNELLGHQQLS